MLKKGTSTQDMKVSPYWDVSPFSLIYEDWLLFLTLTNSLKPSKLYIFGYRIKTKLPFVPN